MQIASYNSLSPAEPILRLTRLEDQDNISHHVPSQSDEEKRQTSRARIDYNPIYEDITDDEDDNPPSDIVTCMSNIEMQSKGILTEDIVVGKTGEKRRHSAPEQQSEMSRKPKKRKRRWSFNTEADVEEPVRKRCRWYNHRMTISKEFNKYKSFITVTDSPEHETGYDTEPDIDLDSLIKKEFPSADEETAEKLGDEETGEKLDDEETEETLGDESRNDSVKGTSGVNIEDEDTIDAPPTLGVPKQEIKKEKSCEHESSACKVKLETLDEKHCVRVTEQNKTFHNTFSLENVPDHAKSLKKDKSVAYCEKPKVSDCQVGQEYLKKCDIAVKSEKKVVIEKKIVKEDDEPATKEKQLYGNKQESNMSVAEENDVIILETIKHSSTNTKRNPIDVKMKNSNSVRRPSVPIIIITDAPCATVTSDCKSIHEEEVDKGGNEKNSSLNQVIARDIVREKETKEKTDSNSTCKNVQDSKDKDNSSKVQLKRRGRKPKSSESSEEKNGIERSGNTKGIKKRIRKIRNSRRSFRHESIQMFQVSKEPHVPWGYTDKKSLASEDKTLATNKSNSEKVIITDLEDDAPSPCSLTIDLDDRNTIVEDHSVAEEKKKSDEIVEIVSDEVNATKTIKKLPADYNKKTTKPDTDQSEDQDIVGEPCEEEADNKQKKNNRKRHTENAGIVQEMKEQHLMSDMKEKGIRIAKELPRFNWLEEKIRNGSLPRLPARSSDSTKLQECLTQPQTKKMKLSPMEGPSVQEPQLSQEDQLSDRLSSPARKPVIVSARTTDVSPLLQQLTTTGDLEITLSTPPAASSTASSDSGVSIRTHNDSEPQDMASVSVKAVLASKPSQPLPSPPIHQPQQQQQQQQPPQPQPQPPPAPSLPPPPPQLSFPPPPPLNSRFGPEQVQQLPPPSQPVLYGPRRDWETDPSVRKVVDSVENSNVRSPSTAPPQSERVMYSDRIATMARHAATSFDTGLVGPAAVLEAAHRAHRQFQRPSEPPTNSLLQPAQKAALLQSSQMPQQSSNEAKYQQVGSHPAATLSDSPIRTQVLKPSAQYPTMPPHFQPPVHPPYISPPHLRRPAMIPQYGYPGSHPAEIPVSQTSQVNNNNVGAPAHSSMNRMPPQKAANSPSGSMPPPDRVSEQDVDLQQYNHLQVNQYRYLQICREEMLNSLHALDLRLSEAGRAIQANAAPTLMSPRSRLAFPPQTGMETQPPHKAQDHSMDNKHRSSRRNRVAHAAHRQDPTQGTENPIDLRHMHMTSLPMHLNHHVPEQRRQEVETASSLAHLQAAMPPSHLLHSPDLQRNESLQGAESHVSNPAMHHREESLQSLECQRQKPSQMAPQLTQHPPAPPGRTHAQKSPTSSHRTLTETIPAHQLATSLGTSRTKVPVASSSKSLPSSQLSPSSSRLLPPMIPNPHLSPGFLRSPQSLHSALDNIRNVPRTSEDAGGSHSAMPPPPPLQPAPQIRRDENNVLPSSSRETPIDLSVSKQKTAKWAPNQPDTRSEEQVLEVSQHATVSSFNPLTSYPNNPRIPFETSGYKIPGVRPQMPPSSSINTRPHPVHSSQSVPQMAHADISSQVPLDHMRHQMPAQGFHMVNPANSGTLQSRPRVTMPPDTRSLQHQAETASTRNPTGEQPVLQNDGTHMQMYGQPMYQYPIAPMAMPRFTAAEEHYFRCVACSQPARFMCSACHRANYCTPKCQTRHWNSHRPQCRLEQERQLFLASGR